MSYYIKESHYNSAGLEHEIKDDSLLDGCMRFSADVLYNDVHLQQTLLQTLFTAAVFIKMTPRVSLCSAAYCSHVSLKER